jgi:tRNA (guanine10-N2)-methyltransferase
MTKDNKFVVGCTLAKKKKRREKNFARTYELPNRIYLGPVSLAHDLAFLMAN